MQHKQIRPGDKDLDAFDNGEQQGFGQGVQVQPQYQHGVTSDNPMMLNQVTGYNLAPNQLIFESRYDWGVIA